MNFEKYTNFLSRLANFRRLSRLPSHEEFQAIIRREIARVDRRGDVFSLVCFRLDDDIKNTWKEVTILKEVTARIRSTDMIGRMKKGGIGIVLFGTPESGAQQLATTISLEIATVMPPPYYVVYTYPTHWYPNSCSSKTPKATSDALKGSNEGAGGSQQELIERAKDLEKNLFRPITFWKRVLDIILSLTGIFLLSPLYLLITLFIKMVSPGPVLFRQQRMGHLGRPFDCFKFRTMKINADQVMHRNYFQEFINNEKPMSKMDTSDPRIIPFGEFLRHSGLDELPQLFNILKGDMSLIGPRPCLNYEAREYELWHTRRFDVSPGITGLWQVEGKNRTTFAEMICHDINYTRKKSLFLDLKILFKTIPAILADLGDLLIAKKENRIERSY